jgi:hypothetical protein
LIVMIATAAITSTAASNVIVCSKVCRTSTGPQLAIAASEEQDVPCALARRARQKLKQIERTLSPNKIAAAADGHSCNKSWPATVPNRKVLRPRKMSSVTSCRTATSAPKWKIYRTANLFHSDLYRPPPPSHPRLRLQNAPRSLAAKVNLRASLPCCKSETSSFFNRHAVSSQSLHAPLQVRAAEIALSTVRCVDTLALHLVAAAIHWAHWHLHQ